MKFQLFPLMMNSPKVDNNTPMIITLEHSDAYLFHKLIKLFLTVSKKTTTVTKMDRDKKREDRDTITFSFEDGRLNPLTLMCPYRILLFVAYISEASVSSFIGSLEMSFDLKKLELALSSAKKGMSLKMVFSRTQKRESLSVQLDNKKPKILSASELDQDRVSIGGVRGIESIEYPVLVDLYHEIVEDVIYHAKSSALSEIIEIYTMDEKLFFIQECEVGTLKGTLKYKYPLESYTVLDELVFTDDHTGGAYSLNALSLLKDFSPLLDKKSRWRIFLKADHPLKVNLRVEDLDLYFYLAPRSEEEVDDDDDN